MNSNKGIYILAGVILLLVVVYFFLTNSKNHKWYETYQAGDKNPFGGYVLVELFKETKGKDFVMMNEPLYKGLKKAEKSSNYIFIGNELPLDSIGRNALLRFVQKGNNAFIASNNPPLKIYEKLSSYECVESEPDVVPYVEGYVMDSMAHFNFSHPRLKIKRNIAFKHQIRDKGNAYSWKYLDSAFFCTVKPKITLLGTLNDTLINFYRVAHGKGNFYFHTNPIAFTNYHLLQKGGKLYGEGVFSHLNSGKIYWDEYNKLLSYSARTERSESPLKFILSEPSLKMAWYLALALIIIYVIFYAKRKQRIIPVLELNSNSSLEFTETIGRLYFQQSNHAGLCRHKMKFFLGFIREKYHMPTNVINNIFINKLSQKSGIPLRNIEIIFQQYSRIKSMNNAAEDTLINFHQALEYFYQKCK